MIETKFSIGDVVVRITRGVKTDWITCPRCSGRGFHMMDNGERDSCGGCGYHNPGKIRHTSPTAWIIDELTYKIQSIDAKADSFGNKEVRYPTYSRLDNCSGTLWREEDCFATKEDALAECSRRNQKEKMDEVLAGK